MTMQHIGTVTSNQWVNHRYKHMIVEAPDAARLVRAGQFFHLLCGVGSDPLMRRPMSIYRADPARGELHFLYQVKGIGTKELANLKHGDVLDMVGPLGQGFWLDASWQSILLVARGVGLATLAPLTEMAGQVGIKVHAILSARNRADILSEEYMKSVGANVEIVTDEDGSSDVEAVRKRIVEYIHRDGVGALFTCGSKRLTRLLQDISQEYRVPGQVALEENMGCALGMCFCCVRPFQRSGELVHLRVCKDGPVFSLAEVLEG